MKADCQWFTSNLEAYFCDKLSTPEMRQAREHIESCAACHAEVNSLHSIDPIIKQAFRERLAVARAPRKAAGSRIAFAGAGLALAALLAIAVLLPNGQEADITATRQPIADSPALLESADIKSEETDDVRAKPDAETTAAAPLITDASTVSAAVPFSVTDPAGYSTTLEDYRGYAVVIGVWKSDQPAAVQNIERIYQTFGRNTSMRVLGVAAQREDRPAGTTFPIVFNNGSHLLGAATSEFVLLDPTGNELLRGSLLEDSAILIARIRTELNKLQ